jgi:ribosomal protein S20
VAQAQQDGQSQRAAITGAGVARSTLRHWNAPAAIPAPAALVAFVETPEGVVWLRRILAAAHWGMSEQGGAGVRVVCDFLERSGLSAFIGASYGAQQAFQGELEEQIVTTASEQRETLAQAMPHRLLNIAEDETWKDGMRLVGMDPVSNFILLEQGSDERSAAAWTQALKTALQGLNVTVVQGTSDEAKGLLAHVERDLGAHHSTDLFHLQHEVSQAMSLALKRAEQQAETAQAQAKAHWQGECAAEQAYHRGRHGPGRPPVFAARIKDALKAYVQASLTHERAQAQRAEAKTLIGAFSEVDHPYDLQQGQAQTPEQLQTQVGTLFARLEVIADEVALSDRLCAHLAKAKRLTHRLIATLAFFFMMVNSRVQALDLAPAIEQAMLNDLIPALYLERAAARSTDAEQRHRLRALSAQRLAPLQQPAHPIQSLDQETRRYLEQVAGECADLFQRSSSCVEGRNGFLALYQHGHHRLSPRKQQVLTALHNFAIKRSDGTTAAERFFAQPHPALFEQVLERMPWPARPARRRPRPARQPYLTLVAA